MQRSLELAYNSLGYTYPNPIVGAVITHQNKIIGEGWHKRSGEAHAEVNAINSVKNQKLLSESEIYVTLEPCSHQGKTPSCAKRLVKENIQKVYVGSIDSNDLVSGKGIEILSEANIPSEKNILAEKTKLSNKRFFTFHTKKRPYIILKWAESEDGFLDQDFKTTKISNNLSSQFVHQLRAQEDAILVGTKTALNDNPDLTTRNVFGRNPKRVIIDLNLKIPQTANIFNSKAETFIVNTTKEESFNNIHYIKICKDDFIKNLLEKLHSLQIQSIIIEGGSFTLQQFIESGFWDEAIVIKAPCTLNNGTKAPILKNEEEFVSLLRNDKIFFYKNQH